MEISIIGAGPAGSYCAYLLAKKGYSVSVYEKNSIIGSPVQCTGILSDYFSEIMKPNANFVINTVNKTRIYSPNNKYVETKLKTNYVICRKKFDNYLVDLAKKAGAKFYLNHTFKSFNNGLINLKNKSKIINKKTDVLIGADGPNSAVAKSVGLFNNRKFVFGTQIEAKLNNDNVVEFYPYIGCYAWIVPVNKNIVRIGVTSYKNSACLFKKFAEQKLGKNYKNKIIEHQSGVIPVFNPRVKAQKDDVYLIGDAATFNKTTSGGGINQSLRSAERLFNSIENKKNYQREWRKKLYRGLYVHLVVHKALLKFKDEDWNNLIAIFSEPKMKQILYSESRDKIIRMLVKIALAKPSLIKYGRYFPFEELINLR